MWVTSMHGKKRVVMGNRQLFIILMGLWVFGTKCEMEQMQMAELHNKEVVQTITHQGFMSNLMRLYPLVQKLQNFIKIYGYNMITLSCTVIGLYMNYYYSREQLACSKASLIKSKDVEFTV